MGTHHIWLWIKALPPVTRPRPHLFCLWTVRYLIPDRLDLSPDSSFIRCVNFDKLLTYLCLSILNSKGGKITVLLRRFLGKIMQKAQNSVHRRVNTIESLSSLLRLRWILQDSAWKRSPLWDLWVLRVQAAYSLFTNTVSSVFLPSTYCAALGQLSCLYLPFEQHPHLSLFQLSLRPHSSASHPKLHPFSRKPWHSEN